MVGIVVIQLDNDQVFYKIFSDYAGLGIPAKRSSVLKGQRLRRIRGPVAP